MTTIFFERAWALWLIIPAVLLTLILTFKNLMRFHDDFERINYVKKRRARRFFMMLSRLLVLSALIVALAAPATVDERRIQGDTRIKIFIDDSRSMDLFDTSVAMRLRDEIGKQIPVALVGTGQKDESALGDFIVRNMERNDNILLLSDGQSNKGKALGDVLLLAHKLNASINTVSLAQLKSDSWVTMTAPSLSSAGTETPVLVAVRRAGDIAGGKLTISVDGQEWIAQDVTFGSSDVFELPLTKTFAQGSHQLIARLETKDSFADNNVFRTVIKVEPKPKILLLTSSSNMPIRKLLDKLFDVTMSVSLPADLSPYSAIIIDNMQASSLPPYSRLTTFVTEGKGLFVIGGPSSIDRGGFKGNQIENLLPVSVGTPKKEKNQTPSIVFVIDISDSSGAAFSSKSGRIVNDVEEDIAISILRSLSNDSQVGAIAFNTKAHNIANMAKKSQQTTLEEGIASLQPAGGTIIAEGLEAALFMVSKQQGSKSIVLISDGVTALEGDARAMARAIAGNNIKLFTVGVGDATNEKFMKELATLGKGSYYRPKETDSISIVVGAPEKNDKNNASNALSIVDFNDFITKDLTLIGRVSGFNSVIPKSSAKLLVTLADGRPILTTWRFGLGRVAVLSTDDGTSWAGTLLNEQNSPLLSKSIFWTVGDPRAAKTQDVMTTQGFAGEPLEVMVKSNSPPQEEGVSFSKIDENLYTTTLTPAEPGFIKLLGQPIAVNYPRELVAMGQNDAFANLIAQSGGETYTEQDIQKIIDSARQHSVITEVRTISWAWAPLALALGIFLIEIIARRLAATRGG